MRKNVVVTWNKSGVFVSDVAQQSGFLTMNGNVAGQSPLEVTLAALGGCLGVYAEKFLVRHAIAFSKIEITVSADFLTESPTRLSDIVAMVITDAALAEKADVFYRFVANCPVHNTLTHTEHVTIRVNE